jgi:hypothetical protein
MLGLAILAAAALVQGGEAPRALPAGHAAVTDEGGPPALRPATLRIASQDAVRLLKQQARYTSLMAAVQAARYQITRQVLSALPGQPGAYEASNPAQELHASFSVAGVHLLPAASAAPAWRWGLRLAGWGYGEKLAPVPAPELSASDNRIEYRYPRRDARGGASAALTEWYVNGPHGLEHGFTLPARPAGSEAGGPLRVQLAVSGELRPHLELGGGAVQFRGQDGKPVLQYRELHAFDATGRALPSRLAIREGGVAIEVEERGAVYPVTVDPLIGSHTKLTAGSDAASAGFGASVAVSGDTALVGAWVDTHSGVFFAGSAYVFVRSGTTWSLQQKLTAPDAAPHDAFGLSVAVSGDTALVGAYQDDHSGFGDEGSAYVFVRSGTTWSLQQKLTAPDAAQLDYFGKSVELSGDTD